MMDVEAIPPRPKDKAELMERIQREWSALLQTVEKLSPEQMTMLDPGGWSPKDNLAHLTVWEQYMLRYHLRGEPPHQVMQVNEATYERLDTDELNAILLERNRHRSVEEILVDLNRSHAQVVATLEDIPFADLMKQHFSDDPQRRPVIDWVIGNTYDHYQEHRRVVEANIGD
jgi:hypothetical protein